MIQKKIDYLELTFTAEPKGSEDITPFWEGYSQPS